MAGKDEDDDDGGGGCNPRLGAPSSSQPIVIQPGDSSSSSSCSYTNQKPALQTIVELAPDKTLTQAPQMQLQLQLQEASELSNDPQDEHRIELRDEPTATTQSQATQITTPTTAATSQWLAVAAQTSQGIGQRMSLASDQLSHSIRQLYASASSITQAAAAGAAGDVPPPYHHIPGIVPYYQGRTIGPPPSYDDVINPYAPPPTYQSLFGQMREARKTSRGLLDLLRRLLIILVSTLGCTILIAFMILIPFTMILVGAIYIDECQIEHIPAFLLVGGLVWASKNIIHCYGQCRQPEDPSGAGHDDPLADLYRQPSTTSSSSSTSGSGSGSSASSLTFGEGASGQPLESMGTLAHAQTQSSAANGHHHQQQQVDTAADTADASTTGHHNYSHRHHRHHHQHHQQRPPISGRRLKRSICESLLNCVLIGWFIAGCVIVFRNYEPDFENSASLRYCHRTVYMYAFWLITSALIAFGLFIGCICCLMVSSAVASRQDDLDLA